MFEFRMLEAAIARNVPETRILQRELSHTFAPPLAPYGFRLAVVNRVY